jgi:hypothetical protein
VDSCDVGIGPLDTHYYELFVSSNGAIAPGEFIDIDLASVEQNIRATTYDSTDLDVVPFVPNSFIEQNLSL